MFDLNVELNRYLAKLKDQRLISRSCLNEIESHLRDEIEEMEILGSSSEEAFLAATKKFGTPYEILQQYNALYQGKPWIQFSNLFSHYFNGRVVMRLISGLVLGSFFMWLGLILEGGHVGWMIQPNTALIVVGGAFGALLIAYPLRTVTKSFLLALTGRDANPMEYASAARVFKSFGDFSILTGFVGVIFGVVHVLQHLSSVDRVGAGLAVAFVALLYGFLCKLFVGTALASAFNGKGAPPVNSGAGDRAVIA